jgi:tight adherence protein B
MVNIAPLAIFLGAAAAAALTFVAFWDSIHKGVSETFNDWSRLMERGGVRQSTDQMILTWAAAAAIVWLFAALLFRPSPVVGLLMLPITAVIAGGGYLGYIRLRTHQRNEAFVAQLELVLRLMSSALRTGMGLRQSLNMVVEESPEPARYEYTRVIGQANIGVSILDALDDLAARIPRQETLMMARVIRVQSQTGGDLGKILDQLANTIKERRRIKRKIQTLTAEGRVGAIILAALPIFLGLWLAGVQPHLRDMLLHTAIGHGTLLIVLILEALGIFTLTRMLKVRV